MSEGFRALFFQWPNCMISARSWGLCIWCSMNLNVSGQHKTPWVIFKSFGRGRAAKCDFSPCLGGASRHSSLEHSRYPMKSPWASPRAGWRSLWAAAPSSVCPNNPEHHQLLGLDGAGRLWDVLPGSPRCFALGKRLDNDKTSCA